MLTNPGKIYGAAYCPLISGHFIRPVLPFRLEERSFPPDLAGCINRKRIINLFQREARPLFSMPVQASLRYGTLRPIKPLRIASTNYPRNEKLANLLLSFPFFSPYYRPIFSTLFFLSLLYDDCHFYSFREEMYKSSDIHLYSRIIFFRN